MLNRFAAANYKEKTVYIGVKDFGNAYNTFRLNSTRRVFYLLSGGNHLRATKTDYEFHEIHA